MSDKSQVQPVQPVQPVSEDENKNDQPAYTVKLFGRYVPMWVVVLVVTVLLWVAWSMWSSHQKNVLRLTSSTRMDLDKAVVSPVSLGSASAGTASAGIPLSTPSTEETRKQLNKLFNSF